MGRTAAKSVASVARPVPQWRSSARGQPAKGRRPPTPTRDRYEEAVSPSLPSGPVLGHDHSRPPSPRGLVPVRDTPPKGDTMTQRRSAGARLRAGAALVPALALATTGMVAASAGAVTAAPAPVQPGQGAAASEAWINYVQPRAEKAFGTDKKVGKKDGAKQHDAIAKAMEVDRKHPEGNPVAARQLAKLEAKAIKTGKNPKQIKSQYKGAKATQEAKLLTILVEFNDERERRLHRRAGADASSARPTCEPGDGAERAAAQQHPEPGQRYALEDNNSMWVPDFSPEHFNKMLFTKTGITERVRTDLKGPDGKPGFDISGLHDEEHVRGDVARAPTPSTGAATPWVTVPHSEAYYGATVCFQNEDGVYECRRDPGHAGPPRQPARRRPAPDRRGRRRSPQRQPDFPWADYDIEDQGDRDGDGNFNEPDGVIDHVVLVHAGEDKSGGGGAEGTYAIWAHSSAVAGGATIPGTDLKLSQLHRAARGLRRGRVRPRVRPRPRPARPVRHLGRRRLRRRLLGPHVLGLALGPDLPVDADAHGPLGQVGARLGRPGRRRTRATPAQTVDRRPDLAHAEGHRGRRQGQPARQDRHPGRRRTAAPNMWYTSADQDWADVRLARTIDVPAGATDAKFWMWNNYIIEEDWDFGFVEVSTDGGTTWTEQKVFNEAGDRGHHARRLRRPERPHGRLRRQEVRPHRCHRRLAARLRRPRARTPARRPGAPAATRPTRPSRSAAGSSTTSRVTDGATTVWSDDVEAATTAGPPTVGTFADTTGAGWRIDTGTSSARRSTTWSSGATSTGSTRA